MNATSSIWTKEFRYRLILRKALLGLAAHLSLKDQPFQVTGGPAHSSQRTSDITNQNSNSTTLLGTALVINLVH